MVEMDWNIHIHNQFPTYDYQLYITTDFANNYLV